MHNKSVRFSLMLLVGLIGSAHINTAENILGGFIERFTDQSENFGDDYGNDMDESVAHLFRRIEHESQSTPKAIKEQGTPAPLLPVNPEQDQTELYEIVKQQDTTEENKQSLDQQPESQQQRPEQLEEKNSANEEGAQEPEPSRVATWMKSATELTKTQLVALAGIVGIGGYGAYHGCKKVYVWLQEQLYGMQPASLTENEQEILRSFKQTLQEDLESAKQGSEQPLQIKQFDLKGLNPVLTNECHKVQRDFIELYSRRDQDSKCIEILEAYCQLVFDTIDYVLNGPDNVDDQVVREDIEAMLKALVQEEPQEDIETMLKALMQEEPQANDSD